MEELGNMEITSSAIAPSLMWHVHLNVFSLFEIVLQA